MASSPTSTPSESEEVTALDNILFRLASADSDAALQSALHRHLPGCLARLGSGREAVRKKVMELLVHINKRIKDNDNVQLPMEALLKQYQVQCSIYCNN